MLGRSRIVNLGYLARQRRRHCRVGATHRPHTACGGLHPPYKWLTGARVRYSTFRQPFRQPISLMVAENGMPDPEPIQNHSKWEIGGTAAILGGMCACKVAINAIFPRRAISYVVITLRVMLFCSHRMRLWPGFLRPFRPPNLGR